MESSTILTFVKITFLVPSEIPWPILTRLESIKGSPSVQVLTRSRSVVCAEKWALKLRTSSGRGAGGTAFASIRPQRMRIWSSSVSCHIYLSDICITCRITRYEPLIVSHQMAHQVFGGDTFGFQKLGPYWVSWAEIPCSYQRQLLQLPRTHFLSSSHQKSISMNTLQFSEEK